jgi:putative nucleotidyltransferase with HDIG domain
MVRARPAPRGRAAVVAWLVRQVVDAPQRVVGGLVVLAMAMVLGGLLWWMAREPMVAPGLVMQSPRLVRADFALVDQSATESAQRNAALQAPRVYALQADVIEGLRISLENLPRVAAEAGELDKLSPEWRRSFALDERGFELARRIAADQGESRAWSRSVAALDRVLKRTPIVDLATFQAEVRSRNERMELLLEAPANPALDAGAAVSGPALYLPGDERAPPFTGGTMGGRAGGVLVRTGDLINLDGPQLADNLLTLAARAGFTGEALLLVQKRLFTDRRPTFRLDEAATAERQREAKALVRPVLRPYKVGDVLALRGQVLSGEQVDLIRAEQAAFDQSTAGQARRWLSELGALGLAVIAGLGLVAYGATYCPRMVRSPSRLAATAGLFALAALLGAWFGAAEPRFMVTASVVPTALVALVIGIAFDRRTALAVGWLMALFMGIALRQEPVLVAVSMAGVGGAAWHLRELRSRAVLLRAAFWAAGLVVLTSLVTALMRRPLVDPITGGLIEASVRQILADTLVAGAGVALLGFLLLGMLPIIERVFSVTTTMTLLDLRDPRHPLLRQLQQRAPGTYNHSINVANLAEAAAEAIGADGLLAYAGALYHDVGKMTKPDFFVENQAPGFNRHERLPPAVSLMVIIGHVRDGMELAREHRLPPALLHFIESHHGTTLVEYFYHRARRQAEQARRSGAQADVETPDELEYRYPGPRPRTREAALLMICDAAESATRTLPEPSPARIEALVRAIAHKRLIDGQFDQCELTLRDLNTAADIIARSLASIHHARIAYPDGSDPRSRSALQTPLTPTQAVPSAALAAPPNTPPPSTPIPAHDGTPSDAGGAVTQPLTGPAVEIPGGPSQRGG